MPCVYVSAYAIRSHSFSLSISAASAVSSPLFVRLACHSFVKLTPACSAIAFMKIAIKYIFMFNVSIE